MFSSAFSNLIDAIERKDASKVKEVLQSIIDRGKLHKYVSLNKHNSLQTFDYFTILVEIKITWNKSVLFSDQFRHFKEKKKERKKEKKRKNERKKEFSKKKKIHISCLLPTSELLAATYLLKDISGAEILICLSNISGEICGGITGLNTRNKRNYDVIVKGKNVICRFNDSIPHIMYLPLDLYGLCFSNYTFTDFVDNY